MVINNEMKNEVYKRLGKGGSLVLYRYHVTAEEAKLFAVSNSGEDGWTFLNDGFEIGFNIEFRYEKIGEWFQSPFIANTFGCYCYEIILLDDDDPTKYISKVQGMIREDISLKASALDKALYNMENGDLVGLKGKVYICSPLSDVHSGIVQKNAMTARHLEQEISKLYHCRAIAPHGYLTFLLDDSNPEEREIAIEFDKKLLSTCDSLLVCSDRISKGMREEICFALENNIPVYSYDNYRVSGFDEKRLMNK